MASGKKKKKTAGKKKAATKKAAAPKKAAASKKVAAPKKSIDNSAYFLAKIAATKARHDVFVASESGQFDFVLLDTRPRDAYTQGHIQGAWCAPIDELDKVMAKIPKTKEVVTYCWGHD